MSYLESPKIGAPVGDPETGETAHSVRFPDGSQKIVRLMQREHAHDVFSRSLFPIPKYELPDEAAALEDRVMRLYGGRIELKDKKGDDEVAP